MNSKVYKYCIVPQCHNTTIKTPNKVFVHVPNNKTVRDEWLQLARRVGTVSVISSVYFCEDHFDLPNDMANYMQYHLMGSVCRVRMKPGCKPTKFECQQDGITQTPNPVGHPFVPKNQSIMMAIGDSVKDLDEKSILTKHIEPEEVSSGSSEAAVHLCDYARRVKEEPGLEHEASVKQEEEWGPVKEEPLLEHETSINQKGCWPLQEPSEAAGLYAGHEVKSELVLGPTTLQPPDASATTVWLDTEHTHSPLAEQVTMDTKQYECEICLRKFSYNSHLRIHKQIHTGELHKPDFSPKQMRRKSLHAKEKFKCDVCGKQFSQYRRFVVHKRIHVRKKPYQCETCSKLFVYKSSLVRHERFHVKEYECDSCQMKFSCKASVEVHVRGHAVHLCPICGARFGRREALLRHAAGHVHAPASLSAGGPEADTPGAPPAEDKRPNTTTLSSVERQTHDQIKPRGLACTAMTVLSESVLNVVPREKCSTSVSTTERSESVGSSRRSSHNIQSSNCFVLPIPSASIVHHDHCYTGKNFLCHICWRLYSEKASLISHQLVHTDEKPYKCVICLHRFRDKSQLNIHTTQSHTGEKPYKCHICLKQFAQNASSISFSTCELCLKKFSSRTTLIQHKRGPRQFSGINHLNVHKRIHTGEKPFQCETFLKKFPRETSLIYHIRTTDEKPYKCEMCLKQFVCKYSLTHHIHINTGEGPYKCDICLKQFVSKCTLTSHKSTHADKKPYKCEMCYKEFGRKNRLTYHIRTHTGEKPYKCETCLKRFVCKYNLTLHIRKFSHRREIL